MEPLIGVVILMPHGTEFLKRSPVLSVSRIGYTVMRLFFCPAFPLVPRRRKGHDMKDLMYYDTCGSGKRIQELRKAHGMTQAQLAEALNISLDHLRKIEGGQRGCSVDLLIALAAAFDVSLDFLVLGRGGSVAAARDRLQTLIDELTALKKGL